MSSTPLYAGVDVGSVSTAAVVVDCLGRTRGSSLTATGAQCSRASEHVLRVAGEGAGLNGDKYRAVAATGYGRERVPARTASVTEITCHARGIASLFPDARFVIDVGGQDCKAVRIDEGGRVVDFAMNDRCAAGTGRFFETMCRALEIDLDELGPLALSGDGQVAVSHVCTVFAESEVVGLLAQGTPRADVAAAVCRGAARQVAALARRVGLWEPVALSGGPARNTGFVRALEGELGLALRIPSDPDLVGALGAALLAREQSG
jgi:(R)-2-hydroxyacyl-CoA dehydratese activating ATPase